MTEIEWLGADGRPIAPAPPRTPREPGSARAARFVPRSVTQWVEIAWVVAAGLAVLAPFLQLYRLQIERGNLQEVDGWGRFDTAVNLAEGSGAHGIRFGIVSVAAAGLVLVLLVLRRRWPGRSWSSGLASVAGALAEGLLVATTAAIFLDIDALIDSIRSELSRFTAAPDRPSLHVGAGAWTMLAAAAVGLVAVVADTCLRRVAAPTGPGAASNGAASNGAAAADLPLEPGDERL